MTSIDKESNTCWSHLHCWSKCLFCLLRNATRRHIFWLIPVKTGPSVKQPQHYQYLCVCHQQPLQHFLGLGTTWLSWLLFWTIHGLWLSRFLNWPLKEQKDACSCDMPSVMKILSKHHLPVITTTLSSSCFSLSEPAVGPCIHFLNRKRTKNSARGTPIRAQITIVAKAPPFTAILGTTFSPFNRFLDVYQPTVDPKMKFKWLQKKQLKYVIDIQNKFHWAS